MFAEMLQRGGGALTDSGDLKGCGPCAMRCYQCLCHFHRIGADEYGNCEAVEPVDYFKSWPDVRWITNLDNREPQYLPTAGLNGIA